MPRCDLGVVLVDSASTVNQEDLALLRALYSAGIPAILLLSKADLLAPSDRERMAGYIREQIRRELGLDLAFRPVSTVGADESLLTRWFEQELTPLLEQHRALVEASLKRKIAHLRESVISTLESILARRRAGKTEGEPRVDTAAAIRLLEGADEAIRRARDCSSSWSDDRLAFEASIPTLVAKAVLAAPASAPTNNVAELVEKTLYRRGMAAHEVLARLQDVLATTIESLRRVSPLADADVTAVRDLQAGGLPTPYLYLLRDDSFVAQPWWARIIPPLAARATERWIRRRFEPEIGEVVQFHDRQLHSWLKTNVARVVEPYEAQASAFREQIRRLAAEPTDDGAVGGQGELEANLRELRQDGSNAVVSSEQPGVVQPTVSREYGAGGGEVASRLAKALGWELLDHELLHRAAQLEHLPDSELEALDERAVSLADRFRLHPPHQRYIHGLSEAAHQAVAQGNVVLVGRGSRQNETDFGKLLLAACFITDLGTVAALGACFANYDRSLLVFAFVAAIVLWLAPRFVEWFFTRFSTHVSEPGVKMVFFVLFGLGALATLSNSEAVLPAYMVGLALAGVFAHQRDTLRRLRTTVFAFLTPFYFLNAGMKVNATAVAASLGLIVILLAVKLITKTIGVWPLTQLFRFGFRESAYTTLLMSTGLTFGTISALFGLTHGYTDPAGTYHTYINQEQYSILVTVVIGSAIVPTVIAQTFFKPEIEPVIALEVGPRAPVGLVPGADGAVGTESRAAAVHEER